MCPRCLIPKSKAHLVGTKRDISQRTSLARRDDHTYRSTINEARKKIFDKNFAVDSEAVERLLKPQSLVPTEVSPSRRRFLSSVYANL